MRCVDAHICLAAQPGAVWRRCCEGHRHLLDDVRPNPPVSGLRCSLRLAPHLLMIAASRALLNALIGKHVRRTAALRALPRLTVNALTRRASSPPSPPSGRKSPPHCAASRPSSMLVLALLIAGFALTSFSILQGLAFDIIGLIPTRQDEAMKQIVSAPRRTFYMADY